MHGLTSPEVIDSRKRHGSNQLYARRRHSWLHALLQVVREPMFMLLAAACAIYFAISDWTEAWLMFASILFVAGIEIVQEYRSDRALEALRKFTAAQVRVVRDGVRFEIPAEELVVGDILFFSEGERVAADAEVFQQNDLSIDEAVLTGESLPVEKIAQMIVYQGTTVASGQGVGRVAAVGEQTEFGKLGKSIESLEPEPTPLQRQIERFVKQMGALGAAAFALVFALNYWHDGHLLSALLFSLTVAMALIPEEIPVAFSSFMALGAYRMTRKNLLAKQPKTVESLGSATVICLDKTGTITENQMSVAAAEDFSGRERTLEFAMWASEPEPFDAMERAIHQAFSDKIGSAALHKNFSLAHEYALSGVPPMMTHIWQNAENERIVACKGAVERVLDVCDLAENARQIALDHARELAGKGYRVLGVASAAHDGDTFHAHQNDYDWQFEGLVAFYDPPKKNIREVLAQFYEAGVAVKMLTGDHANTALNIAEQSGLRHNGTAMTGAEIMQCTENQLLEKVREVNVFARMFPDAKLRVVEALKKNGEVVAMTGDGVNDGPALKAAQIGVAMGQKGTEIAKSAASLVLLDDDLASMATAIEFGRRIYDNLRKAIRYIISIHLPIVLTVVAPLVFGWQFLHILTPIHVIFLELIMDPTCAIAFENEPSEPNLLRKPPRSASASLFSFNELIVSVLQGIIISLGVLAMYHFGIQTGSSEATTRSLVFVAIIFSNIFLTFANRSFEHTIRRTIFFPNPLIWWISGIAAGITFAIVYVPFLQNLFKLAPLSAGQFALSMAVALASVGWIEVWKAFRQKRGQAFFLPAG